MFRNLDTTPSPPAAAGNTTYHGIQVLQGGLEVVGPDETHFDQTDVFVYGWVSLIFKTSKTDSCLYMGNSASIVAPAGVFVTQRGDISMGSFTNGYVPQCDVPPPTP